MTLKDMQYYGKLFLDWLSKINDITLMNEEELKAYLVFFNDWVVNKRQKISLDFRTKETKELLLRIWLYDL